MIRVISVFVVLLSYAWSAAAECQSSAQKQGTQQKQDTQKDQTAVTAAAPPRLNTAGKFHYFVTESFRPGVLISAGVYSGYTMLNPPGHYSPEWKNGVGGFARNFGDFMASWVAVQGAKFVTASALREDPRYFPSKQCGVFRRTVHALVFVVADRSDSGARMPAVSNVAGALAGGWIGNAYLPDGYHDASHAWTRSGFALIGFGTSNLVDEFRPEIDRLLKKLHLPLVR